MNDTTPPTTSASPGTAPGSLAAIPHLPAAEWVTWTDHFVAVVFVWLFMAIVGAVQVSFTPQGHIPGLDSLVVLVCGAGFALVAVFTSTFLVYIFRRLAAEAPAPERLVKTPWQREFRRLVLCHTASVVPFLCWVAFDIFETAPWFIELRQ